METAAAVTAPSARPTPTYRLRRWATVGLASLAFVIATVETAAEPGAFLSQLGIELPTA